jgi:hypothetical protein
LSRCGNTSAFAAADDWQMVGREMVTIDQGNRILNSLDWQGLGDKTNQ